MIDACGRIATGIFVLYQYLSDEWKWYPRIRIPDVYHYINVSKHLNSCLNSDVAITTFSFLPIL